MDKRKKPELTPMQQKFCECYVVGETSGRLRESVRRAGYRVTSDGSADQMGRKLMQMPKIQETVRRLQIEQSRRKPITVESVLSDLQRLQHKAEDEGNFPAALKAVELQGKHLSMFTDRIEHVRSIEDVSEEELLGLIAELGRKVDPEVKDALSDLMKPNRAPKTKA